MVQIVQTGKIFGIKIKKVGESQREIKAQKIRQSPDKYTLERVNNPSMIKTGQELNQQTQLSSKGSTN